MCALLKMVRVLLFFCLLLCSYGISSGKLSYSPGTSPTYSTPDFSLPAQLQIPAQLQSRLYSPEKLTLPDALVSPVPSFQFGFVESIACFLFILFCLYVPVVIKETVHFFTNSYFHTLFSSLILINAP